MTRSRKALGDAAEALTSTPTGVRLHAACDVQEFERTTIDGADEDELVSALALWRGEPHLSLLPTVAFSAHAHQLHERRLQMLMQLADSSLQRDKPDAVISLLQKEAETRPTHEGLACQLATAYAAAGRKGEALGVLEVTRTSLRDDLGVQPGAVFEQVERQVLNDAFDITPFAVAGEIPSSGGRFVGRQRELEMLAGPARSSSVIVGEPGIGKTRLLAELGHILVQRGATVIAATSPQKPTRAMETLNQVLQKLDVVAEGIRPETALALRRVHRDLAPDPDSAVVAPIRREGMVALIAEHIRSASSGHETVLLLDDAQWIDRGSAEVLNSLISGGGLQIVLGMRPRDEADSPLELDNTTRLELGGLDMAATQQLATDVLGDSSTTEALAERILQQSGGNPLSLIHI